MTWLRTPPDAKPDAQAATPEGRSDAAVDVQDVTPRATVTLSSTSRT